MSPLFKFHPTGRTKKKNHIIGGLVAIQQHKWWQHKGLVLLCSQAPMSICPAYWDIQNIQPDYVERRWRSMFV